MSLFTSLFIKLEVFCEFRIKFENIRKYKSMLMRIRKKKNSEQKKKKKTRKFVENTQEKDLLESSEVANYLFIGMTFRVLSLEADLLKSTDVVLIVKSFL